MDKNAFTNDILFWFDTNKRILPWRDNPSPYRVWISEIMLQQTKVSTVVPYFDRFISTLPSLESLANVEEDTLLKLWEGLGYYNRARNLQLAAKKIIDNYNGLLPSHKEELESLPGIGPYTSGAILSIAFNKKYSAVDGNVLRVFSRILEIKEDIKNPKIKRRIKDFVEETLPLKNIGNYNQALMEIGALICLPKGEPKCSICPVNSYCNAYKHNTHMRIPVLPKKKAIPKEQVTITIIRSDGKYLIEKRPNKGLLASMYQFPMMEKHLSLVEVSSMYEEAKIHQLPNYIHKFTHKHWHIKAYLIDIDNASNEYYVSMEELDKEYSLPKAFNYYKNLIKEEYDD